MVPRFLGCLLLIPALTIMADFMGVAWGRSSMPSNCWESTTHQYLENSQHFVSNFDLFAGVFKSLFFGAAIALIACYRGFHCDPGAEGVGRAATAAFVYSFVVILLLDLLLGIALEGLYFSLWPDAQNCFSRSWVFGFGSWLPDHK